MDAGVRNYYAMSALTNLTGDEAAELFGVSRRTVCYARSVFRDGSPSIAAALESGLISVFGAAWAVDHLSPSAQDWLVARQRRGHVKQRLKIARRDVAMAERMALKDRSESDAVPRPGVIPRMADVAVSAARAAARVKLANG
jgi:hypothetical protein